MRYLLLALFIFCMSVSASIINATGFFTHQLPAQTDWFSDVNSAALDNQTYSQTTVQSSTTNFGFGDFTKGLYWLAIATFKASVGLPWLLYQYGVTTPFNYFLSLVVWMIYLIGLADWIANRNTKGMT